MQELQSYLRGGNHFIRDSEKPQEGWLLIDGPWFHRINSLWTSCGRPPTVHFATPESFAVFELYFKPTILGENESILVWEPCWRRKISVRRKAWGQPWWDEVRGLRRPPLKGRVKKYIGWRCLPDYVIPAHINSLELLEGNDMKPRISG